MQNWQNNGQTGSAQGHNNNMWSGSFGFPNGSNQYGAAQDWTQQMHNQNAFSHLAPQSNGAENSHFGSSPHQGHAAVANDHNTIPLNQGNYHNGGHGHFALDPSYADPGQDDPLAGLTDFPQDMYGHQGKSDFAGNIDNLSHTHTPDYANQPFQYNGQTSQMFNGNVSQFNDTQLMPQQGHQNPPQLQQRFEPMPQSYSPAPQGYVQSPQQRSAQPERGFTQSPHPYQPQHAHQQNGQPFSNPSNPTPPPYQQNQPPAFQQHKLVPQQMSYSQPSAVPTYQPVAPKQLAEQARTSQHTPQPAPQAKAIPPVARSIKPQPQLQPQLQQQQQQQQQQQPPHIQQQQHIQHQHQPLVAAGPVSQPGTPPVDGVAQPEQAPAKKRKRPTKKETELEQADSPSDSAVKKADDGENLVFPSTTEEEAAAMAQFKKRSATAKKQFPPVPGAPFLACSGTVKMPTPKSYDRLAPLVALPSTSGRRIIPEQSHDLPCEIQGRFTDKYRPSPNFSGKPEDRELEAKPLIEHYQREMKLLGNRRPKYTDYPFTLQEQLKADEAAKSKAQRKARKEEEEERKKPIRPETRPSDPVEGAVWDVLGIVYVDPSATRTNALIASAVQALGEFFIKLRSEMNRAKQEADQAVKEAKPDAVVAVLTKKTDLKKETLMKVCEAAAKHGDEAVLENLGDHSKGILSLVNTMIGCIKSGDFNGPLPKAILRLMSNTSMSKKVALNVNFENVRKRLADKGDEEVKELVRTIASRIKKDSDSSNGIETKKTSSAAAASKAAKSAVKANDGSPAKRVRDDDSDPRTVKKVAVESTSASGSKVGAKPAAPSSLLSKFGASKPRPTSSTTLAGKIRPPRPLSKEAVKPDPAKAAGPPSSTPMDVDKKPPAAAPKPEVKAPAAKPAASSGSSLSSIASLLDSINTPKADSQATQAKDSSKKDTSETPEERTKRLRKEARRKLRVTWKADSELVQVRIFHKEAAEDEDNMTKDAADDRSEGMMLKQRANFNEDDDDEEELPYQPWVQPGLADLSRIPQEYRAKSFVTRGGDLTFRTDEQKAIEEREKKELMVIYTDVSDIPPTPKSPPLEPAVPNADAKTGQLPQGESKYDEIHQRWKEMQQFGWEAATYYARKRLDAKDDPAAKLNSILGNLKPVAPAVTPEPYNMTPPGENAQPIVPAASEMQAIPAIPFDDKVHGILISDKVKNWRASNPFNPAAPQTQRRYDYPDPLLQAAANHIEDVVEKLRGLPYPATNPPEWLAHDPERVREWWAGFQKDSVARAKKEAEDRPRVETEASTQQTAAQPQDSQDAWAAYYQQQQYAQYMALMQQMQGGQPAQPATGPAGDAQLQALLAQMGQPQPPQAAPQGGAVGLNPQDTGYQQLMMLAQLQQQQQQQPSHQQQPTPAVDQSADDQQAESVYNKPAHGRKLVDYSDRDSRDDFDHHRGRDRDRDRDRDRERDGSHKGKQGKNRKGNAPGGATLPPHRPVNRALIGTKPCSFWQQGKCARGDKCTFRHDN